MEDPRINEYRQSTFYQTKTSNEIKLNVAVEEADARNSGRDPMQPQILCSLRFNSGLWYWYSSLTPVTNHKVYHSSYLHS